MINGLVYVLVGGLIGYGGTILNYIFSIKKQQKDEIWKEKIRIYSKVIEELGKSFIDLETFPDSYFSLIGKTKFAIRLGSILAPARLIASDELETELRELYEEEIAWVDTFHNEDTLEDDKKVISDRSIKIKYKVEQLMRKELKQ